ncbi:class III extradiol ring-cleavage dioxygenase family protein [Blastococcus goldschmidtiae]|uniref:Catalytic LigB subunit of aromatic ring-opening dioxygenase n=1 Tax=Blastococcus goldschmidtiae TaxID=3075546 RepID=A0ABU2K8K6_9ACTN|nr:hypothetical protein [Blastococcus sp. DSM 46792]MDT0276527.1 hypothetical protein [Blastococcus sp. DSM 46792]
MSAESGSPPLPSAGDGPSVAFCPPAPLLLPAVEGRAVAETTDLRRACRAAVAAMLAVGPETVVVVAEAPAGTRHGAGDVARLRGLGLDLDVPFAGPSAAEPGIAGVGFGVGAWLLDEASFAGRRIGVGPADLAGVLGECAGPVGVLALGDGSARRGVKAPGYLDEAAGPFDAVVAGALARGDAAALAALDPAEGRRLLAAGVPVWRAVGSALAGRSIAGRLHADAAPFGVGYLVADWTAR